MNTGAEMTRREIGSDLSHPMQVKTNPPNKNQPAAVQAAVGILEEVSPRAPLPHLCGVDRARLTMKPLMPVFEFAVREIEL